MKMKTYRLDDIVHQLPSFVNLVFSVCHDQAVKIFLLIAGVSGIRTAFSFFDGAFATDRNLSSRFGLHLLERISTGPYE